MKTVGTRILIVCLLALSLTLACFYEPRPDLEFGPDELPAAQTGVQYEATVTVSGNFTPVYIFFVSDGALPDGLKLEYTEHDTFAKIVGIPAQAGTFKFTLAAWCLGTNVSGQTGEKGYVIEVK